MNNEEMRAALEAAKTYKAKQISEAEESIQVAQSTLRTAEARLEAWQAMIPVDVLRIMQEDLLREAHYAEEAARTRDREAKHAAALREAYSHHKGILPPEAASKSNSLGIAGAIAFCACSVLTLKALFGVESEVWLSVFGAVGGLLGLFAGFAFFDANFVVDESLERDAFAYFKAHDTVRETYFKRRND